LAFPPAPAPSRTALLPETPSVFPLPEALEPEGGELGAAGGVPDVAVPGPFLDRPGAVLAVGEGEAAGMARHAGMDREGG
jgi:hypothetical protein